METSKLKNSVLKHVESADEQLLKLMKALAESYENQDISTSSLSEKQYEILDERRRSHLAKKGNPLRGMRHREMFEIYSNHLWISINHSMHAINREPTD